MRDNLFDSSISGRYRRYWETPVFDATRTWSPADSVAWVGADSSDFSRPGMPTAPELYNLDSVGYESLVLPVDPYRTASKPPAPNLVRLHIGLEDPEDLIADLAAAFGQAGLSP